MNLNFKNKFALIAGSAVLTGALLTGAAYAASNDSAAAPAPSAATAQANNLDQAVKDGKLTQAQADLMKQIGDLRKSAMEKVQADSKAIIDQAVKDGKITQDQADKMLKGHGGFEFGKGGFGHGKHGFGRGGAKGNGGAKQSQQAQPAPAN